MSARRGRCFPGAPSSSAASWKKARRGDCSTAWPISAPCAASSRWLRLQGWAQIDKDARRMEGNADRTLKDITAAHLECPRCSHFQLETSHCARCGVDIQQATAQKRKEDLLIQKKIRDLRGASAVAPSPTRPADHGGIPADHGGIPADARSVATAAGPPRKRASFVRELFRRT
ncbi:MAG: hypothetical protein ACNA7W_05460 [Pseudomonadales bacterium]